MCQLRQLADIWGDGTPWVQIPRLQQEALAAQIHLVKAGEEALFGDPGGMLGRLSGLRCPVLLIEGGASPPVIGAVHAGLAARIPQAERVVVAGAAHMLPITHPTQVSGEVLRFLRGD